MKQGKGSEFCQEDALVTASILFQKAQETSFHTWTS